MYLYFYLFPYCLFSVQFLCCYLRAEISESWVWTPSDWSKSVTEVGAHLADLIPHLGSVIWGVKSCGHLGLGLPCRVSCHPQTPWEKQLLQHVWPNWKQEIPGVSHHEKAWSCELLRSLSRTKNCAEVQKKRQIFSCQINQNLNSEVQSKSKTCLCRYILFPLGPVHGTLASS